MGLGEPAHLGGLLAVARRSFLLLFTGLYMFVLPYAAKWRSGQALADRSDRNGQKIGEGRKEGRRQAGRREDGKTRKKLRSPQPGRSTLLSGGNPQIAKAYGDAPVQAYIAAMPGWKRDVGRRLDALIVRTVPGVHKAVKWNSPLLRRRGPGLVPRLSLLHEVHQGGFLPRHVAASCPARRVQAEGRALPRHPRGRRLDEAQFAAWVKQASQLPGERM